MTKKILLINDMPGYGKVAVNAMTPILVRRGFEIFYLPTMIISNTLNYGRFASIDTTDYMVETLKVWQELGFKFDAVAVGYTADERQVEFILKICRDLAKDGAFIYVDPIMADNGKLYNSVSDSKVEIMRNLISVADCISPNITEAAFLTGCDYKESGYTEEELKIMAEKLHDFGAKSVIITSALLGDGTHVVAGFDGDIKSFFTREYEELPVHVNGTGDSFFAAVIAELLGGANLADAVGIASDFVGELIGRNMDIIGEYNGLPIEASIELWRIL